MHAYFYLDIYIQFITSSILLSSSLTLSLDWESTVSLDYIFKRMLTSVLFNFYYSFISHVVSPSSPIPSSEKELSSATNAFNPTFSTVLELIELSYKYLDRCYQNIGLV
jgi:hypothetical protein